MQCRPHPHPLHTSQQATTDNKILTNLTSFGSQVLATPAPAPATAAVAQQLILQHSQRPPLADLSLDSCNGAPVLLQVFQPSQQPGAAPAAVWQPADVECPYPVEWLGGAAEQRVLASIGLAQAAAKLRAAQQASMAAGR